MPYQLDPALWSSVFAVPGAIVDTHLRLCSGLALKALLWILRHPGEDNSPETLAKVLRQAPSDVADALNFWEEHGVLAQNGAEPSLPRAAETPAPPHAASPAPKAQPLVSRIGRPHFPREEAIALVDREPELASLLEEGQAVMGKAFTSADLDSLVALHSYYGLSLHFILTAIHYCASIGRRSVGYVESVCVAWLNDGVTDETIGAYVDTLRRRQTNEERVRKAFGIDDRRLIAKERDYIANWFDTLRMPLDLIVLAYEKTVENTGKLSFAYINTILTAWSKKQIDTVEKAKAEALPKKRAASKKAAEQDDWKQRLIDEFMNDGEETR